MSVIGLSDLMESGGGVSAPTLNSLPTGCTYASASQNFVCPSVTASGSTITSNYFLLDATGNSMSTFDASKVAALRVRNTISGTAGVSGNTYTIDGQQDYTLSGLQSSTHTLNGTGTLTVGGTRTGSTLPGPFTTHSTTTISNVVLPAYGASNPYPASGRIALDQSTSFTGGSSMTSQLVMTFNGTSRVTVSVKIDNLSLPGCTFDLSNGGTFCG
jgi:hypothetical protein